MQRTLTYPDGQNKVGRYSNFDRYQRICAVFRSTRPTLSRARHFWPCAKSREPLTVEGELAAGFRQKQHKFWVQVAWQPYLKHVGGRVQTGGNRLFENEGI